MTIMRWGIRPLAVLAVAGGLLLAACGDDSGSSSNTTSATTAASGGSTTAGAAAGTTYTVNGLTFTDLTVKPGETVTIKNNGPDHTMTSDDGKSFNVSLPSGGTATLTAPTAPGAYKFHCNIHSSMKATLTVSG